MIDYTPIKATFYPVRTGSAYVVRYGRTKKSYKTKSFRAGEEVSRDDFIKKWNTNLEKREPHSVAHLSKKQISEIQYCYQKLDGIEISLSEIVDVYIKKYRPISNKLKLSDGLKHCEHYWRKTRHNREESIINARNSVFNRFIRQMNDCTLNEISAANIEKFIFQNENVADATRRNYLRNLNNFFSTLMKIGYMGDNPCAGLNLGKQKKKEKNFYKPWELWLFLHTCLKHQKYELLFASLFSAFSGMRLRETTRVSWKQIGIKTIWSLGHFHIRPEDEKTSKRKKVIITDVFRAWFSAACVNGYEIPNDKSQKISSAIAITKHGQKIRQLCCELPLPSKLRFRRIQNGIRQAFAAHHFSHRDNIYELS
ncbi:phage integrase SAM-like domain-containing protein, partial [Verrucomicrobia bacterium]|nr:phage integrase SAM-like domain-containing protein [Verrucomicrobiota bacterium]